jgi:hypothetical protein
LELVSCLFLVDNGCRGYILGKVSNVTVQAAAGMNFSLEFKILKSKKCKCVSNEWIVPVLALCYTNQSRTYLIALSGLSFNSLDSLSNFFF